MEAIVHPLINFHFQEHPVDSLKAFLKFEFTGENRVSDEKVLPVHFNLLLKIPNKFALCQLGESWRDVDLTLLVVDHLSDMNVPRERVRI
jgi:extradiol dioxygenase family protein